MGFDVTVQEGSMLVTDPGHEIENRKQAILAASVQELAREQGVTKHEILHHLKENLAFQDFIQTAAETRKTRVLTGDLTLFREVLLKHFSEEQDVVVPSEKASVQKKSASASGAQKAFDKYLGRDGLKLGRETWRLYVDGLQQNQQTWDQTPCSSITEINGIKTQTGWVGFEKRELGCLSGMHSALQSSRETIDEDLSLETVCNFHQLCTKGTSNLQEGTRPGIVRMGGVSYGFIDEESCGYEKPNREGRREHRKWEKGVKQETETVLLRDFSDKFSNDLDSDDPDSEDPDSGSGKTLPVAYMYVPTMGSVSALLTGKPLEFVSRHFIDQYNQKQHEIAELDGISLTDRKNLHLKEIIKIVTILERLHVFPDANGRTFCTVLLNRELIKFGFPPVVLDNPNMFDGCKLATIEHQIRLGFERFELLHSGQLPERYVKTEVIQKHFAAETDRRLHDPISVLTQRPA